MSDADLPARLCRCEARIPAAILNGYACGNPDCWRTAEAAASFQAFVARLAAARGEVPITRSDRPETPRRS